MRVRRHYYSILFMIDDDDDDDDGYLNVEDVYCTVVKAKLAFAA